MNLLTSLTSNAPSLASFPAAKPDAGLRAAEAKSSTEAVAKAEDIRQAFTSFVGETFFAQMTKAMRSTVQKPAYFHGGQAEEVFQSQLDQQLAQELTTSSGDRFAQPMFEQQFPAEARLLREVRLADSSNGLDQLGDLRRR